jgi:hypothetical protein
MQVAKESTDKDMTSRAVEQPSINHATYYIKSDESPNDTSIVKSKKTKKKKKKTKSKDENGLIEQEAARDNEEGKKVKVKKKNKAKKIRHDGEDNDNASRDDRPKDLLAASVSDEKVQRCSIDGYTKSDGGSDWKNSRNSTRLREDAILEIVELPDDDQSNEFINETASPPLEVQKTNSKKKKKKLKSSKEKLSNFEAINSNVDEEKRTSHRNLVDERKTTDNKISSVRDTSTAAPGAVSIAGIDSRPEETDDHDDYVDDSMNAEIPTAVVATAISEADLEAEFRSRIAAEQKVLVAVDAQVAIPVNEQAHSRDKEIAALHEIEEKKKRQQRRRRLWCCFIASCVIASVAVVIAVVLMTQQSSGGNDDGVANNTDLTRTDDILNNASDALFQFLSELSSWDEENAISDLDSPQNQAFRWVSTLIENVPIVGDNNASISDWNSNFSELELVQLYAMATLFFATDGPDWINSENWLQGNVSICDWAFSSDMIEDDTCETDTTGLLPSPPDLSILPIPGSRRETEQYRQSNTISTQRGHFRELRRLQQPQTLIKRLILENNNLAGTIVPELALLSDSVVDLRIGFNPSLTGELPTALSRLSRLETFYANDCSLSGTMIPSEYGSGWTSLRAFHLEGNQDLGGTIPATTNSWTSLEEIWHEGTACGGAFPTAIGSVSLLMQI